MSRTPFSLKSAHLLMWSSPLLLLVLVFTLTASSPHGPAASSRPPSSTSPVTTPVSATTTSTLPMTTTTTPVIVTAKTTTKTTGTTSSVANNFSSVTTSSVKPVAPISNANAMSGALSGTLGPGIESVDVPLLGPGNWTLSTSVATNQSLDCGNDISPVVGQVVVGADQTCQLEITATSDGTSSWQLTPTT